MKVYYSINLPGRYFIFNGAVDSDLKHHYALAPISGAERDWVLSQSRNFKSCDGFSIFDGEYREPKKAPKPRKVEHLTTCLGDLMPTIR